MQVGSITDCWTGRPIVEWEYVDCWLGYCSDCSGLIIPLGYDLHVVLVWWLRQARGCALYQHSTSLLQSLSFWSTKISHDDPQSIHIIFPLSSVRYCQLICPELRATTLWLKPQCFTCLPHSRSSVIQQVEKYHLPRGRRRGAHFVEGEQSPSWGRKIVKLFLLQSTHQSVVRHSLSSKRLGRRFT